MDPLLSPMPRLPAALRSLRPARRLLSRLAAAAAVAGLAGAAAALETEPQQAQAPEPALSLSLTQQPAQPEGGAAAPLRDAGTPFSTATQTMVWAGRGRVALGFGVEQRWRAPVWAQQPDAQPTERDGQLLLGLSLRTSTHTRLVWQTAAAPAAPLALGEPGERSERRLLALDMRRSDAYRALVRGSLRMELGQGTALSLKPRGRRIGIALTSQW